MKHFRTPLLKQYPIYYGASVELLLHSCIPFSSCLRQRCEDIFCRFSVCDTFIQLSETAFIRNTPSLKLLNLFRGPIRAHNYKISQQVIRTIFMSSFVSEQNFSQTVSGPIQRVYPSCCDGTAGMTPSNQKPESSQPMAAQQ